MKTCKFLILLLACQFIYSAANAQRIKDEIVTVSYNRLPDEPLSSDFTTYSTSVEATGQALSAVGMTEKDLSDRHFKLRAFKKLPKGGHFHINAKVNPITILSSEVKTEVKTIKDGDGNEKKVTQYYRTLSYKVPVTFTLEDKDGNIVEQQVFGSPEGGLKYIFKRDKKQSFNSKAELAKAWSNRTAKLNNLQKTTIEKAFGTFSTLIKRKYDKTISKVSLAILVPAGKKVANADEFKANADAAVKVIKTMKPDVSIEGTKKDLQPMIDFWTTQKDNFSVDNKKEVKIHHACLYNLAVAYLLIENLEEATNYATLAVATKKKKTKTNSLKSFIEGQDKMMKKSEATTLHFPIDLSKAVAPEGIAYKKYEPKPKPVPAKPVDRTAKFEGYYITPSGDSLSGTYVFKNGLSANPKFYVEGDMKFIHDGKERNLAPHKFRKGSFNGRTFKVIKRKPEMSLKKIHYAAEVVETGSKMELVKAFPMTRKKDGSPESNVILIKVAGQEKYKNLSNTTNPQFINWKKGFAKLFEGCEVLYAEIRVGEFERDLDDMAEAVRLFNQNNCN